MSLNYILLCTSTSWKHWKLFLFPLLNHLKTKRLKHQFICRRMLLKSKLPQLCSLRLSDWNNQAHSCCVVDKLLICMYQETMAQNTSMPQSIDESLHKGWGIWGNEGLWFRNEMCRTWLLSHQRLLLQEITKKQKETSQDRTNFSHILFCL